MSYCRSLYRNETVVPLVTDRAGLGQLHPLERAELHDPCRGKLPMLQNDLVARLQAQRPHHPLGQEDEVLRRYSLDQDAAEELLAGARGQRKRRTVEGSQLELPRVVQLVVHDVPRQARRDHDAVAELQAPVPRMPRRRIQLVGHGHDEVSSLLHEVGRNGSATQKFPRRTDLEGGKWLTSNSPSTRLMALKSSQACSARAFSTAEEKAFNAEGPSENIGAQSGNQAARSSRTPWPPRQFLRLPAMGSKSSASASSDRFRPCSGHETEAVLMP
eukprot:scaffold1541_cov256-Pinguiococcus_pyrenoidosus.AAC.18